MSNKHESVDLKQMQSLPLALKVRMTERRIEEWYDAYDGKVYISFSGGKDSSVLLHIARKLYPDIDAVYVDTGLEYPEVRDIVKQTDNVIWLRPKKNFKEVILEYGYPVASKEQSQFIYECKRTQSEKLRDIRLNGNKYGAGKISDKWRFLLDAPFSVSHKCCDIMKKNPAKSYERRTGNKPIMGTMASESSLRATRWARFGCNAFEAKRPVSSPMSFWTDNDVLQYIVENNVPIPSVYGDIVETGKNESSFDGSCSYKTTGVDRTGCMFCMYGCTLNHDQRFARLKKTHPKQYDYMMRPVSDGGLGMLEVIRYVNEHMPDRNKVDIG